LFQFAITLFFIKPTPSEFIIFFPALFLPYDPSVQILPDYLGLILRRLWSTMHAFSVPCEDYVYFSIIFSPFCDDERNLIRGEEGRLDPK
jgi:hypothetical protein